VKIGQAFPSKYIKATDLAGKEFTLTIGVVKIEDVGGPGNEEDRPVLYFEGKTKGVVLNRTNATSISSKYGDDTDMWLGKPVIIYPDTVMFQGKMVDCIRMRIPPSVGLPEDEAGLPF
jgi:hypothetical protein